MNILFDLDGTLTDPQEGILGSLCHGLKTLGLATPPYEDLRWVIGPPLQASISQLVGDDPDLCSKCLELYRERFGTVGLFENKVYDGIPEMLAELRSCGHRLFVATSKPTIYSERIVEHFGLAGFFARVYGSELDGRLADKGELIGHVVKAEGLDVAKTVMIGDRKHDIIGAKANLVAGIGVLYGYGSREELKEAGAVRLAESPGDLLPLISDIR